MAIICSTTVHGNAVVAERPAGGALQTVDGRPYTDVIGHRLGWGATYEGTGDIGIRDTWFHVPLPSPAVLNVPGIPSPAAGRLFLDRFFVLFETQNCRVAGIAAWDVRTRIFNSGTTLDGRYVLPTLVADEGLDGDWSQWGKTVPNDRGQVATNIWSVRDATGSRPAAMGGLGISILVDFAS